MIRSSLLIALLFGALHQSQRATTVSTSSGDPGPRTTHALVFHTRLHRLLLLMGSTTAGSDRLWGWDGTQWTAVGAAGPIARGQSGAVYDARRDRVVVHGGAGDSGSLRDTVEWDGVRWVEVAASRPRDHHAMACDEERGRTVLYGGLHRPSSDRNTWEWVADVSEWDGKTWTTIAAPGPGPRLATALVYDGARKHVLLFGGGDRAAASQRDTWAWNGSQWRKLSDEGPPARRGHAMAFDPRAGVVLLYGGTSGSASLDDMWQWDGVRWTEVRSTGAHPGHRFGHAMAHDAARGRTVLYGGFQGGKAIADTWEWDGSSWTRK